jgi:trigger factor
MSPDELAQRLVRSGELPSLMAEIVRGKALALVLESAKVTDTTGAPVDLGDLRDDAAELAGATAAESGEDLDHDDHEGHDHGDHAGHDH